MYLRILPKYEFERIIRKDEYYAKKSDSLVKDQRREAELIGIINGLIDKKKSPRKIRIQITACRKKVERLDRALFTANERLKELDRNLQLSLDEESVLSVKIRNQKRLLRDIQIRMLKVFEEINKYTVKTYKEMVRKRKRNVRSK